MNVEWRTKRKVGTVWVIVKETDKNRWKIYQNLEINLESLKRIFRESRKDLQRIPKNLGITSNILREFQRNLKRIFYERKHSISIFFETRNKRDWNIPWWKLGKHWLVVLVWTSAAPASIPNDQCEKNRYSAECLAPGRNRERRGSCFYSLPACSWRNTPAWLCDRTIHRQRERQQRSSSNLQLDRFEPSLILWKPEEGAGRPVRWVREGGCTYQGPPFA